MKSATLGQPVDTQVQVVRTFDAPVDQVWRVFTDPQMVSRWMMGPPGWSMPVCKFDFRVGGYYENRFRNDQDGTEMGLAGTFREIEPLTKIVQDETYGLVPDEDIASHTAVVTMTFQQASQKTEVTTSIEYPTKEACDEALATGMTAAMELAHRCIDGLLVE
ncbi:SRPBCC domain-containing protein [Bremerella sp. JC770]|uniref:SRPBCC domain-containing protein n=1 Tax=Bremerella sp. JC770 TaxID=3232137 RepID=UPI00345A60E0